MIAQVQRREAAPDAALAVRKGAPIKVWAVVGAGFLSLQGWVYGSWLASGDAVSQPTGPDPVPGYMETAIRVFEVASVAAFAAFLWFVLIRPWRRAGHITLDGLFTVAFLTMFWQDPLMNLFNTWFTYNAAFVNLGSWGPQIPGWFSPNGQFLPQGVVMFLPAYAYGLFGGTILACQIMRKAQVRWPHLTRFGLIGVCYASLFVLDTLIEVIALRFGLWSFPGAIEGLTLFHGHHYAFPLYEAATLAAAWTAWAALRYFRDDKGRTVVERGADDLAVGARAKTGLRFLSLVGFCNAVYLAYNLVFATFGLHSDPWPRDVMDRSYLTNLFCGEGTSYACPSPELPLARKGSLHVSPSGELVGN